MIEMRALFGLLLCWQVYAQTTILVSSINGTDVSNCGISPNLPCSSISFALTQIKQKETIVSIQPGIYSGLKNCNIKLVSSMSLIGTLNQTVIDCEYNANGLILANITDVKVAFLTIRRGNASSTNVESGGKGGGIFITGTSSFNISNVIVSECVAYLEGGGIFSSFSQGVITEVTIKNNTSWDSGGGIAVFESNLRLGNLQVNYNIAKESAGGVLINGGTSFITGSKITYNRASTAGGGMCLINVNSTQFSRLDISNNLADNTDHPHNEIHGAGGGLYIRGGSFLLNSLTISSNVATNISGSGAGGGIFVHRVHSPSTIINSMVLNNQVQSVGPGAALFCEDANLEMKATTFASPSPYAITTNNCVGTQSKCDCAISSDCKTARLLDGPTCTCFFPKGNLDNSTCACPFCTHGACNTLNGNCNCVSGWVGSSCDDPSPHSDEGNKWLYILVIFGGILCGTVLLFGVTVAYLKWRRNKGYQRIN